MNLAMILLTKERFFAGRAPTVIVSGIFFLGFLATGGWNHGLAQPTPAAPAQPPPATPTAPPTKK